MIPLTDGVVVAMVRNAVLLLVSLALPSSAAAVPVEVLLGLDLPGNVLYDASACHKHGFWLCGDDERRVTGRLEGELDGAAFRALRGTFEVDGRRHDATGFLDFGVAPGGRIGELHIGDLGTFEFFHDRFGRGTFINVYDPDAGHFALWGQNFAPTNERPSDARGLQLRAAVTPIPVDPSGVTPAIPEPGAFVVFGAGVLLVGAALRRARRPSPGQKPVHSSAAPAA